MVRSQASLNREANKDWYNFCVMKNILYLSLLDNVPNLVTELQKKSSL